MTWARRIGARSRASFPCWLAPPQMTSGWKEALRSRIEIVIFHKSAPCWNRFTVKYPSDHDEDATLPVIKINFLALHFRCDREFCSGTEPEICPGQDGYDSVRRRLLSGIHAVRPLGYRRRPHAEGGDHGCPRRRVDVEQLGTARRRLSICVDAAGTGSPASGGNQGDPRHTDLFNSDVAV